MPERHGAFSLSFLSETNRKAGVFSKRGPLRWQKHKKENMSGSSVKRVETGIIALK